MAWTVPFNVASKATTLVMPNLHGEVQAEEDSAVVAIISILLVQVTIGSIYTRILLRTLSSAHVSQALTVLHFTEEKKSRKH
jgi:hypothetical protein